MKSSETKQCIRKKENQIRTRKSSEIKCAEKRNDTISHMEVLLLLISMKVMTDKSLLLLLAFHPTNNQY
jgi:hypothetical protein